MKEIIYQGEHLFWGNIGHLGVSISFVASLFAAFAFWKASVSADEKLSYYKAGRFAFGIHALAVVLTVSALFVIIANHYFEYIYAWKYSSTEMPMEYIFSCFWAGQEGSFMLWMIWHAFLGIILLRSVSQWTAPVMFFMALAQGVLSSMLLGIEPLGIQLGSSPFELMRNSAEMASAPIFKSAGYLEKIYKQDGQGLNVLLQNYWMTIHPPTLFLGFATTIIPFSFAMAGLWKRKYVDWIKPALPWALVSAMILGAGIIMGGMWAYESLSFGGYWAWDPVENASLIPWIILIGAIHAMLIAKSTGHNLKTTFILTTLGFLLVLYATFLTRSGILGDSSVHSFVDLGLSGQLLIFLFLFVIGTALLIGWRWKVIPSKKEEQSAYSREFWMFIGALVLFLSGVQILISTSIPVFNKVFGSNLAPPADVVSHYNTIQLPVAVIIGMLMAITQYFRYKNSDKGKVLRWIGFQAGVALLLTFASAFLFQLTDPRYLLMLFAGVYAINGNVGYIVHVLKGKMSVSGGSVAHLGFGLMLVGVLVSSAGKQVISLNLSGDALFDPTDEKNRKENFEHILLKKNQTKLLGPYTATYVQDSTNGPARYYQVKYQKVDTASGEIKESFELYPQVLSNKGQESSNPDTRHYLTKDIFTYVSSVSSKDEKSWHNPEKKRMAPGDTFFAANNFLVIFDRLTTHDSLTKITGNSISLQVFANFRVIGMDKTYPIKVSYTVLNNKPAAGYEILEEGGMRLGFVNFYPEINGDPRVIELEVDYRSDFIVMKAIEFPYINLLWGGTLILVIGFIMSAVRRMKEYQKVKLAR